MVRQDQSGPTQQTSDRFRAGADEKDPERRALRLGEVARLAVVADDLGLHQVCQHVIARLALSFLDLLADVGVQPRPGLQRRVIGHADPGLYVEEPVDVMADVLTVRCRDAEQRGDHGGRETGAEVLHVVEAVPTLLQIEKTCAERADLLLELCDPARRERLRNQTTH